MNNKIEEAKNIINRCLGKGGVWASPFRYKYQCWTRDFVIAGEDLLLEEGKYEIVKKHLVNLAERQSIDGRIPIMFLDNTFKWLSLKVWHSILNRKFLFF